MRIRFLPFGRVAFAGVPDRDIMPELTMLAAAIFPALAGSSGQTRRSR